MPTNGTGLGLLAGDWDVTPVASPRRAVASTLLIRAPRLNDAGGRSARTSHGLILPDGVVRILEKAPQRSVGHLVAGQQNSTELVSTIRVIITGRRESFFCTAARVPWHLNTRELSKTHYATRNTSVLSHYCAHYGTREQSGW